MKAINLNPYEYYAPDHRTRKAYRRLIDARNALIYNRLSFGEFIEEVERVIFNKIPTNDLKYFGSTPYITILKLLVFSEVSDAATYRLKTDLLTVY